MKKIKITIVLSVILLTVCSVLSEALAQGPGFDPGVTDTPLDGGATIMLAVAAGYGYKKIADKRKKNAE